MQLEDAEVGQADSSVAIEVCLRIPIRIPTLAEYQGRPFPPFSDDPTEELSSVEKPDRTGEAHVVAASKFVEILKRKLLRVRVFDRDL